MRHLWADWKKQRQNEFFSTGGVYGESEWPDLIKAATGDAAAGDAFRRWWDTSELPPWKTCLSYAGLELVEDRSAVGTPTIDADLVPVKFTSDGGAVPRQTVTDRVALSRVLPRGAAENAGLMAGDVLIGIDGLAANETRVRSIVAHKHPGDQVTVSFIREAAEMQTKITLSKSASVKYSIRVDPRATAEQKAIFDDYLNGRPVGTGRARARETLVLGDK
jgi:predicted metalloprotease with PDZ domain